MEQKFPKSVLGAITLQVVLALFMVMTPFGFDHTSSGELDINYLFYSGLAYLGLLAYGLLVANWHKQSALMAAQTALLFAVIVLLFSGAAPLFAR